MLSGGKVVLFNRFIAIFGQKYGSFSPKIFEGILFWSKFIFDYLRLKKKKKESMGKTSVAGPLKKILFFGFPNINFSIYVYILEQKNTGNIITNNLNSRTRSLFFKE